MQGRCLTNWAKWLAYHYKEKEKYSLGSLVAVKKEFIFLTIVMDVLII